MGSLSNIVAKGKKKLKERMQEKYGLSEAMVYKLFRARDKAYFKALEQLGVSDTGLRDSEDNINQTALARRMKIAGVTTKIVDQHDDPRDNGIVFFKNGVAVVAISQPFVERGKIKVKFVEPGLIYSGVA